MESLEYSEWLKHAASQNLFLKESDLSEDLVSWSFASDKTELKVIETDYILFLFNEEYGIEADQTYVPKVFFEKFICKMTPWSGNFFQKGDKKYFSVLVEDSYRRSEGDKTDLYSHDSVSCLTSGSGDGWSRWILWDNIEKMPNFHFVENDE